MLANTRNGKIVISSKSGAMAQPVTSAGTQKVQRSWANLLHNNEVQMRIFFYQLGFCVADLK
jgi:hypothetical protein